MTPASTDVAEALAQWRARKDELAVLEGQLGDALLAAAGNGGEAPRELILAAERKRSEADALLQLALDLLDARSPVKTGMTGFGTL